MPWYNPLSWNKSETETAPKTRLPRRNYQSAQAGRLLADFHGGTTSAEREIRTALKTLRNRSRQLCRNNPYAARALQIYRTQVCGEKGLSLQVRARNVPTGNENQGTLDLRDSNFLRSPSVLGKKRVSSYVIQSFRRHRSKRSERRN